MAKKWIQKAVRVKGGLHRMLNVPKGKTIPKAKIEKATKSKDVLLKKRAILAQTLSKLRK